MKKRRRPGLQKERTTMIVSAALVLTALTLTGVYVKQKNADKQDGYLVDLSELEKQEDEKALSNSEPIANDSDVIDENLADNNDENLLPEYEETASTGVENDYRTKGASSEKNSGVDKKEEDKNESQEDNEEAVATAGSATKAKTLNFQVEDGLTWPIVGNVLLNYSMDKTVYYATLDQYRYSPAIVIAATVGEPITAAADGQVSEVYTNEEIGTAVTTNLGNGYTLTYGQLDNLTVDSGEYVEKGQIIGYVATPTKYYCVEGSNAYFSMKKDGTPINPMSILE